jgi:hypothetical protein
MSMKNPATPAGIEPATYRFVAQHLNHCATTIPLYWSHTDLTPLFAETDLGPMINCALQHIICQFLHSVIANID